MKKGKIRPHEESNGERWLVSYADFITLMFAFFVVMYAISSVNEAKYKIFSESLKVALHSQSSSSMAVSTTSNITNPIPPTIYLNKVLVDKRIAQLGEQQRKIEDRMKRLALGLSQAMAPLIEDNKVSIRIAKRGVVMDISASTLFDAGKAMLHNDALNVLKTVAGELNNDDMLIEVEGHTDDTPIATAQFPSNWELSSVRASSVVRFLIDSGVKEVRLSSVGLAANHPLAPNDSMENRAKNRRVTITVMSPNFDRTQN